MSRIILIILMILFSTPLAASGPTPLPADKAFHLIVKLNSPSQVVATWSIAPGYYLYKDKLSITLSAKNHEKISEIHWPEPQFRSDTVKGKYPVYSGNLEAIVTLQEVAYHDTLHFIVKYQGCSKHGFCYPPTEQEFNLYVTPDQPSGLALWQDHQGTTEFLGQHALFFNLIVFMGLGLMLAFTPCVLPMVPILSALIVGQGAKLNVRQASLLSFTYVMGMALTYAIAGLLIAWLGSSIQSALQIPWVIIAFSGLFVLLAISFFDGYQFSMPRAWLTRLNKINTKLHGGTYTGAFMMGVLSSLIVSPCVSAPLVGVLAYISQTGDVILGGFALLALGIGMGIPLMLAGMTMGKWLPKAGPWMELVKKAWGMLMLAVAIWMLSRVISHTVTMVLWALLWMGAILYILCSRQVKAIVNSKLAKSLAGVLAVYGVVMLTPPQFWTNTSIQSARMTDFITVQNLQQVKHEVGLAQRAGKPVLLDFYADWCDSCVLMDRQVLRNPEVKKFLPNFVLLRVDITNNTPADAELMKHFQVIAPPTVLFFNKHGKEVSQERIVGEVSAKEFLARMSQVQM